MALVTPEPGGDLAPVSISHPSPGAKDAFAKCHIGDQYPIDWIAGMAQVPVARDLLRYVPLTGREPQLKEDSPAWVIQFDADLPGRGEVWTDPICVVTAGDFGFYATGPVKNTKTGEVDLPEPTAIRPDRTLPPLVP